jgi:hypothetical protein
MKQLVKKSIIPLILVGLAIAGLAGLAALDNVQAQSTGSGNITAKAYTSGVTDGTFVKLQAAGVITPATAASDKIVGICRHTAASGKLTSYAPIGAQTTVSTDEAIAVGDLLTCDANSKARVLDASQAQTQRIAAIALEAAADANAHTIDVIVVAGESIGFDNSPTQLAASTLSPSVNASGTVYNVTVTSVITLPATAIGVTYTFICDGPDGTVEITLSPNASDMIRGKGNAGANDKDLVNTKATAKRGDFVTVTADGAAAVGWNIVRSQGTWAQQS